MDNLKRHSAKYSTEHAADSMVVIFRMEVAFKNHGIPNRANYLHGQTVTSTARQAKLVIANCTVKMSTHLSFTAFSELISQSAYSGNV